MRTEEDRESILLHPAGKATAAVIWLHGLGADGHDFVPIVPELGLARDHAIRFVFPHAPVRPVTINNGMAMRAWYDILSLTRMDRQDLAGMQDSQRIVHGYMQKQIDAGIPAARIVLAGFSQGGAIALYTGLRYPQPLAGLLPLSTYLPAHDRLPAEASPANQEVPILMCHGTFDPVLPHGLGIATRDLLLEMGYPLVWHEYPMQHQVCAEEIGLIGRWLRERLP